MPAAVGEVSLRNAEIPSEPISACRLFLAFLSQPFQSYCTPAIFSTCN
jgi:hypothetical protein